MREGEIFNLHYLTAYYIGELLDVCNWEPALQSVGKGKIQLILEDFCFVGDVCFAINHSPCDLIPIMGSSLILLLLPLLDPTVMIVLPASVGPHFSSHYM